MQKLARQVLLLIMGAIFWGGLVTTALASPAHDHHSHHKAMSPFDVKSKEARPHCLLHGHNLDKPCPHHLSKKNPNNKWQHTIAPDCGGSPFRNQSTTVSFGNAFVMNSTFDFHAFFESELFDFQSSTYLSTLIVPFPPPPKFL